MRASVAYTHAELHRERSVVQEEGHVCHWRQGGWSGVEHSITTHIRTNDGERGCSCMHIATSCSLALSALLSLIALPDCLLD